MATVFKRGGKNNRHGYWYVSWWEYEGTRHRRRTKCTRTTDKAAAERIARKYEADTALRREGVIDPMLDAISKESQRTIEEHLVDYESKLRVAGRTDQHVRTTVRYIREIAGEAGFRKVGDISPEGVSRFANSLKEGNKSARTIEAHLTAIKGFTKWLATNHKLPRDPLASIHKPNPKIDRRRERRMLLPAEWDWLKAVLESGSERDGMSAHERLLLYRTAIETGLRVNELRSLTRGRLFLDGDSPFITCKAGSTKNQKDARQHIQPDLAADLQQHISRKAPKAPVFNLTRWLNPAQMLRDDLVEAREAWIKEATRDPQEYSRREESDFLAVSNHEGESIDFHSLRHTCGAWLAMTGAHPKVVQTVMRHSTITLTMDTYGHLFPGQVAEAVGRLKSILGPVPERLAATGTEGVSPNKRSAGRSSGDTIRCMDPTEPYDADTELANRKLAKTPSNLAAINDPAPSVTMPYFNSAPLAQLAEQLTLNQ